MYMIPVQPSKVMMMNMFSTLTPMLSKLVTPLSGFVFDLSHVYVVGQSPESWQSYPV